MANTRRMNRLEELGRVDSEKAFTRKGKRNLKDEKKRIVRELNKKKDGGSLKPVDKEKNPGLAKLPTQVRNKMGYMKDGGKVKKGKKVKPLGKKPKPGSYDYYLLNKPKHSPAPIKPKPKMRSGGRVMQKSNGMSRRGMGKAMRGGGCVR